MVDIGADSHEWDAEQNCGTRSRCLYLFGANKTRGKVIEVSQCEFYGDDVDELYDLDASSKNREILSDEWGLRYQRV